MGDIYIYIHPKNSWNIVNIILIPKTKSSFNDKRIKQMPNKETTTRKGGEGKPSQSLPAQSHGEERRLLSHHV